MPKQLVLLLLLLLMLDGSGVVMVVVVVMMMVVRVGRVVWRSHFKRHWFKPLISTPH